MVRLLISTHFRSFPIIPLVRTLTLAWIPAFAGMTGGGRLLDPFGPVWPRLLLARRLEMGPPWPRLALRSLVRGGPAGPGCGFGWPRQEWPGVAKPLIQLHLVAFRCFLVVYAGTRGGAFRSGQPLIQSHLVSFRLIPLVDWGRGFTLILAFSPQGRRGLTAFTGTTGAGAETGTKGRWRHCRDRVVGTGTGSGGVPWLRPGSDRVGVGLATLAGTLVACVSGLHAPGGRNRVLLQHWNHRTRSMAYLQLVIVALLSFAVCGVGGRRTGSCQDAVLCLGSHPHPRILPSRDFCVTRLADVVLPIHPPGTLVGDTPTPPAVGHRPSALPHSRG